jgi:hypothetical protein
MAGKGGAPKGEKKKASAKIKDFGVGASSVKRLPTQQRP